METTKLEVWVLVDENGDYVATSDIDILGELYEERIGGGHDLDRRTFKITLNVPLPKFVELSATVPAESSEGVTLQVD